jgi:hypothetical protein
VCSQLLEAASIFEVCDLSCTELLERLEGVERAGPSSDLVEYFHTFADAIMKYWGALQLFIFDAVPSSQSFILMGCPPGRPNHT